MSDSRASFEGEKRKHFLELCLREVNKEGYKGVSLTKTSWDRLEKEFNERWKVSYKHKAFKNCYDYLRGDYSLWRTIVGLSGHGFSADTNTINWPPNKWEEVLQKHPKAKRFRNKPLEDVDLLKAIFEGTLAKGDHAWTPLSSQPRPMTQSQPEDEVLFDDDLEVDDDNVMETDNGKRPDDYFEDYSHIDEDTQAIKGAVGALDGTLIDAHIPIDEQVPFRGRGQGNCYQNVMAICDFDMKFIYVMAGWEGIAHDSRVLNETLRNPANNFPIPPRNMYYLCDAAYTHTRGFMTPYRNARYWLRTYRGTRPANRQEKFNHAHAQLRNVIERSFGVLKKRFPILSKMPSYSFSTQRDIVYACMAIHNYLQRVSLNDELFREFEDDIDEASEPLVDSEPAQAQSSYNEIFSSQAQTAMATLREYIARQL